MRPVIILSRCISGAIAYSSANTCVRTILKPSFAANSVERPLPSSRRAGLVMQHETEFNKTLWNPIQVFQCPAEYKYAVVVLNRPIDWKHDVILRIWEQAQVTVTVDGGTHRWLKYLESGEVDVLSGKNKKYVPVLITGDMDSSAPEVVERLRDSGSNIIETPDQNHTDYTKALIQLAAYNRTRGINLSGIYVLAETSGRFDHIIGNINTLYKAEKLVGDTQVIQIGSDSLTWLLRPGFHRILIPQILVKHSSWCGLLPFGSPVNNITTTGLKWNLKNSRMNFGGLVSSSNTYGEGSEVTVNTDTPVIWTMGIEPLKEAISNHESCIRQ